MVAKSDSNNAIIMVSGMATSIGAPPSVFMHIGTSQPDGKSNVLIPTISVTLMAASMQQVNCIVSKTSY